MSEQISYIDNSEKNHFHSNFDLFNLVFGSLRHFITFERNIFNNKVFILKELTTLKWLT